jgi:hypothetical protein
VALSTPAVLTSGGAAAATSHTTASVTAAAGALQLLAVHLYVSSGSVQPAAPSVSGLSRTWTQVGTDVIVDNSGTDRATLFLFVATGASGATGALTITPTSSQKATWLLREVTGADVASGAAGAIVQFVKSEQASVSAISTVLAAFAGATNAAWGVVASQSVVAKTWNNSWTKNAELTTNSVTYAGDGYRMDNTQLTQNVTWTTAGRSGAFAVEIKEAGALGSVTKTLSTKWTTYQNAGTLPGSIGGVEPETHIRNPPFMTAAGWLYRVVESDLASGNHPAMYKSLDGGATWAEVDSGNRPSATDLEGVWVEQSGANLIVYVNRDDTCWRCIFSTATDTWGTQETVKTGMSSSGVEQAVAARVLSNGDEWIAYSNTLSGANNQAAVKKRTGANTYGTEIDLGGNTAIDWTVPQLAPGASDVTHVFLKDSTNHRLYWRTLSSAGTLGTLTRIDSAGTSNDHVAHTNAVVYQSGGQEVVGILYTDGSDILKYVRIVAGTPQTPETVSSAAALMDPGVATNGGLVGHLALDGTTVHAVWARASDGSVLRASRTDAGAWSSETVEVPFTAGATDYAEYVYANVYTYPAALRSGAKVLAIVYDVGEHANDVSDLKYTEVTLVSLASVSKSLATSWATFARVTDTLDTSWSTTARVTDTLDTSWSVLTPVSKSLVTSWATASRTTKTLATSWNVAARVTDTLDTSWSVLTSVNKPLATSWTTSARVTKTLATSWSTTARVTDTLDTSWAVAARVIGTRSTSWAVLVSLTDTFSTSWSVLTPVSKSLATSWDVAGNLTQVSKTLATSWATFARITDTLATNWTTAGVVTDSLATSWAVRVTVTDSLATSWTTLARVTSTRSTLWTTVARVTSTRATSWNTTARVTNTLNTGWTTFAQVNKTLATSWNANARIIRSLVTVWNVDGNATPVTPKTLATSWNVSARVTKTLGTTWAVNASLSPVSDTLVTSWAVRARVTSTRATTWHTRANVAPKTLGTSWTMRTSVTPKALATSWTVRTAVTPKTLNTKWNVFSTSTLTSVSKTLATSWNTRARVTDTLVTSWATKARVNDALALKWNTRKSVTPDTLSIKWNTRARVTKTLATSWKFSGPPVPVSKTLNTTWKVRARVTDTFNTKWNVRAQVGTFRRLNWAVLGQPQPNYAYTLKLISSIDSQWYFMPSFGELEMGFEYCDTGTIDFTYALNGTNAAKLAKDSIAVVYCNGVELKNGRWHLQANEGDAYADESYTRWVGKSLLNPLEKVLVLGGANEGQDKFVNFTNVTIGSMLNTLFAAAQTRGAMTGYTWSFTSTVDSNGAAWTGVLSRSLPVTTKYADLLRALNQQGLIEFRFDGMKIEVFNGMTMGVNRATSVELIAGRDYSETPYRESIEERAQFAIVSGDDGSVETSSTVPGAYGPFGREEVGLTQAGTKDDTLLGLVGMQYIDANINPRGEYTRRCIARANGPKHAFDYMVGDTIGDRVTTGMVPYTVRSIVVNIDSDNDVSAAVVLNDKFYELEMRNAIALENLIGGVSTGSIPAPPDTTDKTTPNAPSLPVISSTIYTDTDGRTRAAGLIDWNPPTTNTDGSVVTDVDEYEVQYRYSGETNWISRRVSTDYSVVTNLDPGRVLQARARAFDNAGHSSVYTAVASGTLTVDTTPPSQPSTPTTTSIRGTIAVSFLWTKATGGALEVDTQFAELHMSQTSGFTPSSSTFYASYLQAGSITVAGLPQNANPWYFKIVAVDRTGNRSTPSGQSLGQVLEFIDTGDLAQDVIDQLDAALAAAAAAQSDADTAQATADGKNTVTYSASTPGSTANKVGDIWFQQSGNQILGQWIGAGGTSWTSVTLRNEVIATLDAAKITTGFLAAARIATNSLSIGQTNGLQGALDAKTKTFAQAAIPTSTAAGDFWIDTDDSNKIYRAFAAGVNTIGASAWVLYVDPTAKTTTFAQTAIPTATAAGDIWVDTDDSNKIYRAVAIGANTIGAGAWVLVQDPTAKTTTFAQTSIPTSTAIGDIWVDTDDNNKIYRAFAVGATTIAAGQWVLITDLTTKTTTFAQASIPTSTAPGDLWIDTDDGNKTYRAAVAGATTIAAGQWVLYADLTKTTTFAQTSIPTSTAAGDLWIDTDDNNKIYRAAVAGATTIAAGQWVLYTDLTTKTKTFYQASVPVSTAVGDIWIDSDDNNRQYRAAIAGADAIVAGEWVEVTDVRVNTWTYPGTTNINGGFVQTGTLLAQAIVAHTVGADQMVIGGVSNLVPDGYGEYGTASLVGSLFEGSSGIAKQNTDLPPSSGVFSAYTTSAGTLTRTPAVRWIDVEPGQEYLIEIWLKADIAGSKIYVEMRDQDNAHAGTYVALTGEPYAGGSGTQYPVNNWTVPTTWTKYSAVMTVNATAKRMKVGAVYFNHSNGSTQAAVVSFAMRIRGRGIGKLIVDGSITTGKLAANSVDTSKLVAGSVTTEILSLGVIRSNPVNNSGFEDNVGSFTVFTDPGQGNVNQWRQEVSGPLASAYRSVNRARSGLARGVMNIATGGTTADYAALWSNAMLLKAGSTYRITFSAVSNGAGAAAGGATMLADIMFGATSSSIVNDGNKQSLGDGAAIVVPYSAYTAITPDSYTVYSADITIPGGQTNLWAALRFYCTGNPAESAIFIDDVACIEQGVGGATEITAAGLRLFDDQGTEIVAIVNNRPTLLSITDPEGNILASFKPDGSMTALTGSFNNDITVKGRPLVGKFGDSIPFDIRVTDDPDRDYDADPVGIIEAYSKGTVQWQIFDPVDLEKTVANNGTYVLYDVAFDVEPGRQYTFFQSAITVAGTVGTTVGLLMRYTTNNAIPGTGSTVLTRAYSDIGSTGNTTVSIPPGRLFNGIPGQQQVRVAGILYAFGGSMTVEAFESFTVGIMDLGATKVAEGRLVDSTAATSGGSNITKTYVTEWKASSSESYGAFGARSEANLFQGYYSGNQGHQWASIVFGSANGTGGQPGVSVATAMTGATLKKAEVWLRNAQWYYNAGGTAVIRAQTSTSLISSTPAGTAKNFDWEEGQGKWVDITSIATSGIRGVTLGKAPSTSKTYYGQFSNHSSSYPPKLRLTYSKQS